MAGEITKKEDKFLIEYQDMTGEVISLSPDVARYYFCKQATDLDLILFMRTCQYHKLNPWLKEIYLVKYGTEPAAIITAKATFLKRAEANKEFDGFKNGVVVLFQRALTYREGGLVLDGEVLIGGWAEVYRKDRNHPVRKEVLLKEYIQYTKEKSPNKFWKEKPATMIIKVALVQALRESFTSNLGGLSISEEGGDLESEVIEVVPTEPTKTELIREKLEAKKPTMQEDLPQEQPIETVSGAQDDTKEKTKVFEAVITLEGKITSLDPNFNLRDLRGQVGYGFTDDMDLVALDAYGKLLSEKLAELKK